MTIKEVEVLVEEEEDKMKEEGVVIEIGPIETVEEEVDQMMEMLENALSLRIRAFVNSVINADLNIAEEEIKVGDVHSEEEKDADLAVEEEMGEAVVEMEVVVEILADQNILLLPQDSQYNSKLIILD